MIKDDLREQLEVILNTEYEGLHPICVFDRYLRQDGIAEELLKYLQEDIDNEIIPEDIAIICSGKFGKYVVNVFEPKFEVIHVAGGLRYKDSDIPVLGNLLPGRKFVFVDDSIHTSRTQTKIIKAVGNQNGQVVGAYYGYVAIQLPWIKHVRGILYMEDIKRRIS